MNLYEACAVMKAAALHWLYKPVWESRTVKCRQGERVSVIPAPYLVEVLLLLLYFGNVEQQTPHLPSELQGNSLIDPPDQLEGSKQQEVIVRKGLQRGTASFTSETPSTCRPEQSGGFQSAETSGLSLNIRGRIFPDHSNTIWSLTSKVFLTASPAMGDPSFKNKCVLTSYSVQKNR